MNRFDPSNSDHDELEAKLTAYALGELPDDQRQAVEALLADDTSLQDEVVSIRVLAEQVKAVTDSSRDERRNPDLPAAIEERLNARSDWHEVAPVAGRSWYHSTAMTWIAAAAIVTLLVVGSVVLWGNGNQARLNPVSQNDSPAKTENDADLDDESFGLEESYDFHLNRNLESSSLDPSPLADADGAAAPSRPSGQVNASEPDLAFRSTLSESLGAEFENRDKTGALNSSGNADDMASDAQLAQTRGGGRQAGGSVADDRGRVGYGDDGNDGDASRMRRVQNGFPGQDRDRPAGGQSGQPGIANEKDPQDNARRDATDALRIIDSAGGEANQGASGSSATPVPSSGRSMSDPAAPPAESSRVASSAGGVGNRERPETEGLAGRQYGRENRANLGGGGGAPAPGSSNPSVPFHQAPGAGGGGGGGFGGGGAQNMAAGPGGMSQQQGQAPASTTSRNLRTMNLSLTSPDDSDEQRQTRGAITADRFADQAFERQLAELDEREYDRFSANLHDLESHSIEMPFVPVRGNLAVSEFGIDYDASAYPTTRSLLLQGRWPPASTVRVADMVNYFGYTDAAPADDQPFVLHLSLASCPWNEDNYLLRVALRARDRNEQDASFGNLVFLVDVAPSESGKSNLPMIRQAITEVAEQLGDNDKISIVSYADTASVLLAQAKGDDKDRIKRAIQQLDGEELAQSAAEEQSAGEGKADASDVLESAYEFAADNFDNTRTNIVLWAYSSDSGIERKRSDDSGALADELEDGRLRFFELGANERGLLTRNERLVERFWLDDLSQPVTKELFAKRLADLVPVAEDVTVQIEFNPRLVHSYRLLGHEASLNEIANWEKLTEYPERLGAGQRTVALYELVPTNGDPQDMGGGGERLKYQVPVAKPDVQYELSDAGKSDEWLTASLFYRMPSDEVMRRYEAVYSGEPPRWQEADTEFRFSAAVAAFGLSLRESEFRGNANMKLAKELASGALGDDDDGLRVDFIDLIKRAEDLRTQQEAAEAAPDRQP